MSDTSISVQAPKENGYQENEAIREQAEEYFPLTPIEKKLCAISFGTGIVLLAVFLGIFRL